MTVIWLLLLPLFGCRASPDTVAVLQVIDGDTIIVAGGYRVRYVGIDAPEIYPETEPFAIEALAANRQLVLGKKIRLEKDVSEKDKYGRLLRYVWVDDVMVNAEMARRGLARAKAYPPDTRHQDYLEQLAAEAREAGRGLWAK